VDSLKVDSKRILDNLLKLAEFTDSQKPYTRRAFSPIYYEARKWLKDLMESVGLETAMDAAGNLIGYLKCSNKGSKYLIIGSHIDTVEDAGRFDGMLGVTSGIEVCRVLHDSNIELPFDIKVVDFLCEEPSDFGVSCIGSNGLVGNLTGSHLARLNSDGKTLREAISEAGGVPDSLNAPLISPNEVVGYLELHIEQGPVLEKEQVPIGIVTGIVGISRWILVINGESGHAGTVPMSLRKDALFGAAEVISRVEKLAKDLSKMVHFVATIGKAEVLPGMPNVIPGEVRLVLEARVLEEGDFHKFEADLKDIVSEVCIARGLGYTIEQLSHTLPVKLDARLQEVIAQSAKGLGLRYLFMPSGAGHDAAIMAQIVPAGMIFIPCRNGVSHAPQEWSDEEFVGNGAQVLLNSCIILARQYDTVSGS
jgi:N-carbamoyl-L-amino-acid hydrolase